MAHLYKVLTVYAPPVRNEIVLFGSLVGNQAPGVQAEHKQHSLKWLTAFDLCLAWMLSVLIWLAA